MSTRRYFLRVSSAAVAVAAVPRRMLAQRGGIPVFSNASLGAYQQGLLTKKRFEKLVGSSFHLFLNDDKTAEITLLKVIAPEDLSAAARGNSAAAKKITARMTKLRPPPDKCFIVQFDCGGAVFSQDSYVVDHGTLGSFTVFLVPGGLGSTTCSATFNYL